MKLFGLYKKKGYRLFNIAYDNLVQNRYGIQKVCKKNFRRAICKYAYYCINDTACLYFICNIDK